MMTLNSTALGLGVPYRKLIFDYDWMGRRVRKQVFNRASASTPTEDLRFAYDGWNLYSEYSVTCGVFSLKRAYAWGFDLSRTEQGASGVGGLRSVAVIGGSSYAPGYDGNGNIVAWADKATGQVVARQEYDPFGDKIIHEGI
ncbi:hypothetical protein JIN85_19425, partial [Luteolibacter pohnpeiensis]